MIYHFTRYCHIHAVRCWRLCQSYIGRAESDWLRDPFMPQKMYHALSAPLKPVAGVVKAIVFNYTGYVEAGKNKMAIINGYEYRPGEALLEEGYVLKSISSKKVSILNKADGKNFDIALQE